jgi:hypothetical protein
MDTFFGQVPKRGFTQHILIDLSQKEALGLLNYLDQCAGSLPPDILTLYKKIEFSHSRASATPSLAYPATPQAGDYGDMVRTFVKLSHSFLT